jgi:leucyl aminopeptidase
MFNTSFNKDYHYKNYSSIIMLIGKDLRLTPEQVKIDHEFGDIISKVISSEDGFKGKYEECKTLTCSDKDGNIITLLLVGVGDDSELELKDLTELGGKVLKKLTMIGLTNALALFNNNFDSFSDVEASSKFVTGMKLAAYDFDKFKTKKKEDEKSSKLKDLYVEIEDAESARAEYEKASKAIEGVFLARDLGNEPPNLLYPETYASRVIEELEPYGIDVEVIGEREMHNLGMGALIGVGKGTTNESKLVIMKYNGGADDEAPLAFVGKGVTFDSGGISLKPAANMDEMKFDMCGSSVVVGLMKALAGRKAGVNAVGVIGLVENMPGGNAQRPGDIVTSMSGQTIEILNTDAEGRLVLCDALWYTNKEFKPKFMINLATLTGAIVVSLADLNAGVFSNNNELSDRLQASGNKTGEGVWPFPLSKKYDKMIDSNVADMSNIAKTRKGASSIVAGQFLQRFVGETPWAHLDIAGVSWDKKETNITSNGATGFGVLLLNQLVEDYYETK